jgi:hypothetical protein
MVIGTGISAPTSFTFRVFFEFVSRALPILQPTAVIVKVILENWNRNDLIRAIFLIAVVNIVSIDILALVIEEDGGRYNVP